MESLRTIFETREVVLCFLISGIIHLSVAQELDLNAPVSTLPETIVEPIEPDSSNPTITILPSGDLPLAEFEIELESKKSKATIDSQLNSVAEQRVATRLSKIEELKRSGLATTLQIDSARIDWLNARDRLWAEEEFQRLVNTMGNSMRLAGEAKPKDENFDQIYFRIPALSLRVGGFDYFTAKMSINSKVAKANQDYTKSRLQNFSHITHKNVAKNYYENHDSKLRNLSTANQSELQSSQLRLETIAGIKNRSNEKVQSQLRSYYRNASYTKNFEKGTSSDITKFHESPNGFWLFGDGQAVADHENQISDSSLAVAKTQADKSYSETVLKNEWDHALRHYQRIQNLVDKGYANRPELKKAYLEVQLARLSWEKARAVHALSKAEYNQLKTAYDGHSEAVKMPQENTAESWMNWLAEHDEVDGKEALQFLDLAKQGFQCVAERRINERQIEYQKALGQKYQKIASLQAPEAESHQLATLRLSGQKAKSTQDHYLVILQLRQWAQQTKGLVTPAGIPPETMKKVIEQGRKTTQARSQLSRIEWETARTLYIYHLNRLEKIHTLRRNGRANHYEVKSAYNTAKHAQGAAITAGRNHTFHERELALNKILFQYGCLDYTAEDGLKIERFTPQAITALESLTQIREDVDNGRIQQMEAELDTLSLKQTELNRLIAAKYASTTEIKFVNAQKKLVENRLALEKSRSNSLQKALALVKGLETINPPNQRILPDENLNL